MSSAVFDRSILMESLGGDEALYREIVTLFLKHHETEVGNLQREFAAADATKLQRTAHSMKGSVSNFGAPRATEAARQLEKMLKEGSSVADTSTQVQETIAAVIELAAALRQDIGA